MPEHARFSDEMIADVVRQAVVEALHRHEIDHDFRERVSLELRARILAVLFRENSSTLPEDVTPRDLERGFTVAPPEPSPTVKRVAWMGARDTRIEISLRERLQSLGARCERWSELSQLLIELALRTPRRDDAVHLSSPEEGEALDLLQRRVAKLERALEEARIAVARVSAMERLEPGIASIYRGVQGLSLADPLHEAKREMLELVYRANVELRRKAG